MKDLFTIMVSGSAHFLYPMDTHYGLLWYENDLALEIPKRYPYKGEWGQCLSSCIMLKEKYPMPYRLSLAWLSLVERKFYAVEEPLPCKALSSLWEQHTAKYGCEYSHIIVGMAPYGNVALWFYSEEKSTLLAWIYGNEIDLDISVFLPENPSLSLNEYCDAYINSDLAVSNNFQLNGLPSRNLFENYMKQFTYRYQVEFRYWGNEKNEWIEDDKSSQSALSANTNKPTPEFDYIEEALFDGTHDKLHDGGLMNYHEAGKPKKLAVQWHINKSDYTAYFWFEDEAIREVYDRFYGTHPETKTDFIIRIDAEKNKYELALYRYGLREPKVISESAYQLLVFKSKFECFRSKNYNQPRGAWIW